MKLPVSSEWIEAAISRYTAEHRYTHPEIVRAVERANALPLHSDWNGCVAIRVDGELIEVLWDTPELAKVESDPHWRFVALVAVAKRYAELAHLMPARTECDRDCPACAGTGKVPGLEELGIDAKAAIKCYCAGAGWLPADVPDP
jgi:hypothetical protein